jgi:Na+/H+-dicarboxylate symporter
LRINVSKIMASPFTLLAAAALGTGLGVWMPEIAKQLAPLFRMYIDLLTMIALPFLVTAIIFGLRSLSNDPRAHHYLVSLVVAIVAVAFITVVIAMTLVLVLEPGAMKDPATREILGRFVNSTGGAGSELRMNLHAAISEQAPINILDLLVKIVPNNIFNALVVGDTLKVLIFALLFGMAVGTVPANISDHFASSLDTIYRACILLTRWFTQLLPFAIFALVANQVASSGTEVLHLMVGYVSVFALATVIFISLTGMVLAVRARRSVWHVLHAHQSVVLLALTTGNSLACTPAMIDTLTTRLGFRRDVVELLVPIEIGLLRTGPTLLFVVGTIFVAQFYDRALSAENLVTLGVVSALMSLATAGASSLVVLTQVGTVCAIFGLPFEVTFILFASVEPIVAPVRTLIIVMVIAAVAAIIAPLQSEADKLPAADDRVLAVT